MNIEIPELCLVVLMGPSGSGKSTFAKQHFLPTEVLSSDAFRGWVSDNENDQAATNDAFETLHFVAAKRLRRGRLTVVDATNVQPEARRPLVQLARDQHVLPVAIVLNLPEKICSRRNRERDDRNFGPHVIRQQRSQLKQSLRRLRREGFRQVVVMEDEQTISAASIQRVRLWNDRRDTHGPFDIIGDVHGCADELLELLEKLGYVPAPAHDEPGWPSLNFHHPAGRTAVFVGDLVDRGPKSVEVLSIARNMVRDGHAWCVPGNHDAKLVRKLRGKQVRVAHGLAETLEQLDAVSAEHQAAMRKQLIEFLDGLISHYVFDDGRLVVAHAGLKESLQGRASGRVREFAMYGETTGETDEFGLPVRHNWAADYRGKAMVVYGHTPTPAPQWLNRTINIDTGCVFGGKLTALRYPEEELVAVEAKRVYADPIRPLDAQQSNGDTLSQQQFHDKLLHAEDVIGKRIISTSLRNNITIREENAVAALEVMSRFAVDPRWLIYLPPTMSPCGASQNENLLEHPAEAFDYFRSSGVSEVICEEKHMGSRAVVVIARDENAAQRRFGVEQGGGVITTRTGRRFFSDDATEAQLLNKLRAAMSAADWWSRFETDWFCLDCELMPWSAKAQELLKSQYAAVGAAGRSSMSATLEQLRQTQSRIGDDPKLRSVLSDLESTNANMSRFTDAYRQYCWTVRSIEDYRLAPFHLLASEGRVHHDRDHVWHMQTLEELVGNDELLQPTRWMLVDLNSQHSVDEGVRWWQALTSAGGEGMVVKSRDFITRGAKGLSQPAVKCRGAEYLRIIYGPDYDRPAQLARLRHRHLGRKRSLALREFALGIESLERFVQGEPLRRVHECVFGVLALESEPVDPRL